MKETEDTIAQGLLALGPFMIHPKGKDFPRASQEHLLGIFFHYILQKVRGLVERII